MLVKGATGAKLEYSGRSIYVNTMAVDALASCIARSSVTMVLTMQDKWVLVFHKEGFQLPVLSQFWEIINKAK